MKNIDYDIFEDGKKMLLWVEVFKIIVRIMDFNSCF